MNKWLLDILACPACKGAVRVTDDRGDDVITQGSLVCQSCGARYPILDGVPRMVAAHDLHLLADLGGATTQRFGFEFDVFSAGDKDLDSPEVLDYLFFSRTGLGPPGEDLYPTSVESVDHSEARAKVQGKVILDAGCGSGRFVSTALRAGARRVIGLDLGPHIHIAARRCKEPGSADFVQGSVLSPPFRDEVFDLVFSIGVLHHTPDPGGACLALSRLVRKGGRQSVWVYPPEYWGGSLREPLGKLTHAVLSRVSPRAAFRIIKSVLYPLGRLQGVLARRRWTKLLGAPLFLLSVPRHPRREIMLTTIYDYFCPPIISTHTADEVVSWFRSAGFSEIEEVAVPTAVSGVR